MKIAIIGHTHQLQSIEQLPARGQLALAEADLILHVGNVGSLALLRAIQDKFGLLFAVYSKQDSDDLKRYFDDEKVVEFANRRIGMVSEAAIARQGFSFPGLKRTVTPDILCEQLLAKFPGVDCVVFGSPAKPFSYVYRGKLFFNPGAMTGLDGFPGTMGVLDVTDRSLTGRIIKL